MRSSDFQDEIKTDTMLDAYKPVHNTTNKSFGKISQTGAFKIGITFTMGVAVVATVITCLISFGSSTNAAVADVGKLIIDTDAGADDAVAILLALESEKANGSNIKVVGITCVNGNTYVENVAVNVLKTLKVVDRLDIPVYKGAHHPLLINDVKTNWFGEDGFGDFNYPDPPSTDLLQDNHAVNAMIELVKASPGEITLLCLGPLTNVALAIRMYPSFLNDLRQIIILGGSTEGGGNVQPGVEFNFSVDPSANYIVFNASATSKPIILVSEETASRAKTTMLFRNSLKVINNQKMWLINSAESVSLDPNGEFWECGDAVATSVALTSGGIIRSSSTKYVEAIYDGATTAGMTIIDYKNLTGKSPNTNVIRHIDGEAYKEMLLTLLS